MTRPLAIIDIDGVVADVRHRLHYLEQRPKNWKRFFADAELDEPHPEGLAVVARLAVDHELIFLTGRPANLEHATQRWLNANGLGGHQLVMRPPNDRRPAAVVKRELLTRLAEGRDVGIVVDDDELVIETMRSAGYPTFHADWETRDDTAANALTEAQQSDGAT